MAERKKSVSRPVVGDVGQAGGGAAEDADAILDAGLGIIRADLARIGARSSENNAQLGFADAATVAGYVRALGGIARARNSRGGRDLNKASMEELLAEVAKIPEVRAALEAAE